MSEVKLNRLSLYNVSEVNIQRDCDGGIVYLYLTYRDPKNRMGRTSVISCFPPDDDPVSVYVNGNGIEVGLEPKEEEESEVVE